MVVFEVCRLVGVEVIGELNDGGCRVGVYKGTKGNLACNHAVTPLMDIRASHFDEVPLDGVPFPFWQEFTIFDRFCQRGMVACFRGMERPKIRIVVTEAIVHEKHLYSVVVGKAHVSRDDCVCVPTFVALRNILRFDAENYIRHNAVSVRRDQITFKEIIRKVMFTVGVDSQSTNRSNRAYCSIL